MVKERVEFADPHEPDHDASHPQREIAEIVPDIDIRGSSYTWETVQSTGVKWI